jgi:hypothetical protein
MPAVRSCSHTRTQLLHWLCPPGEAYAKQPGFFYQVQSSAQIDWVYQRNLRFLEDSLRVSSAPVPSEITEAMRLLVMRKPALAEFLADARAHEAVLMHRQRDAEAQDVFAQLGGYRKEEPQIEAATPPMPAQRPTTAQEPAEEEPDVYAGLEVYEAYR